MQVIAGRMSPGLRRTRKAVFKTKGELTRKALQWEQLGWDIFSL